MQMPGEISGPTHLMTVNTDLHVDAHALTSTILVALQARRSTTSLN